MYEQEKRLLNFHTPLGADELLIKGFHGKEGLSELFAFKLDLISQAHNISFQDILGKNVCISIAFEDEHQKRFIHGIISNFSQESGENNNPDFSIYTATMVPWFWLLTWTADSRKFLDLSIPDIIEKVLSEYDFAEYTFRLHGSYEIREYTVQYRETDFNFISRLLEENGIYYFFEHSEKQHTMVLADSPAEHKPCPEQESVKCMITSGSEENEDFIDSLGIMKEIRSGKYTLDDYNFKTPNAALEAIVLSKYKIKPGEREIYDYPGEYTKHSDGERLANIRMEEEEVRISTITGTSTCRAFVSGFRFQLTDCFRENMNNKEFVLTHIEHIASQQPYKTNSDTGGDSVSSYTNQFNCIPYEIPYRPVRKAHRPIIDGVQTAIVVGSSNDEIYTDEHGRVKVQFHWDREGENDENSSCWIRVSQLWAGAGWGAMFIPRVGQEVIVGFEEGDPDRPIITGRVYHGNNTPPYALPAEKTRSTIKSNSTKGGGGSNELRFEDKKGSEEIYIHGQKDWTIAIGNDKNQTIGHNETMDVGNNRTKNVGVDQKETIGSNKTIVVGANHSETIASNMTRSVGKNKTETVTINTAETIGAAKELTIGALYQITVGGAMNETVGAAKAEEIGAAKVVNVGANSSENIGKNKSLNVGKNISDSAGKNISIQSGEKMSLSAGDDFAVDGKKKGVIEIKDELTIKVGKASITLKKSGDIIIMGKQINMKGSGDIVLKGKNILGN